MTALRGAAVGRASGRALSGAGVEPGDVDLAFAIDEGEGFETLGDWRDAHVRFFTSTEMATALGDPPVPIGDDTLVVCTRFQVVERL